MRKKTLLEYCALAGALTNPMINGNAIVKRFSRTLWYIKEQNINFPKLLSESTSNESVTSRTSSQSVC